MKNRVLLAGLITAIGIQSHAAQSLPADIVKLMKQSQYANATWTLYVKDLTSNQVEYDLNANRYYSPGSVSKLFSVAAFLNTFGMKGKIQTPVYALGKVDQDGVLNGNLVLVAKGDLVLGGRALPDNKIAFTAFDHTDANALGMAELTPEDPLAGLHSLAQQIKNNGIKAIEGNVLIDVRYFQPDIKRGMTISPIMINENLMDFIITPTTVDTPATVKFRPQIPTVKIVNKVKTVLPTQGSRISFRSNQNGTVIEVEGSIAAGTKSIVNTFPIQNPVQFAHDAFVQALQQQGIKVNENPDENFQWPALTAWQTMKPVAVLNSPDMLEYAKLILKVSHNIGANLIPALLAAAHGKTAYADGMLYLGEFLTNTAHVDPELIIFGNDAAGGEGNHITAMGVMQLLEYYYHLPANQFQSILYALPILGKDGSLAEAAQNTKATGHVFAKTGTGIVINQLNNKLFMTAKGLAGFYQDKNKHWKAFVISVNNVPIQQVNDLMPINNDIGLIAAALFEEKIGN